MYDAVKEGIEDELRVLLVVAHLSAKGQSFLALRQREVDGVETQVTDRQRVDIASSINAFCGRGRNVEKHVLEVDVGTGLQEGRDGILILALQRHTHGGQQTA